MKYIVIKFKISLFIDTLALENNLRYVNLISLANEECQLIYGDQIVDTMVCVGGTDNEGTCFVTRSCYYKQLLIF